MPRIRLPMLSRPPRLPRSRRPALNSRRKRCRKKSKKPKRAAQARLKRDNLLKNPQLGGSRIKSAQGVGV